MSRLILPLLMLAPALTAQAGNGPYDFTITVENPVTPIKNQYRSGTCWCFAATSFIESELLRMGKGEYDFSEMYTVRWNYYERLQDNFLRRGKGNITEGSIAHMAMNIFRKYGMVPEEAYPGINYDSPLHDHSEMTVYIKAIADASVELEYRSPEYFELQDALFDIYMGRMPSTFEYEGKEYTPETFRDMLGLNLDDYVELTSFSHHPFYEKVSLEIPDNWDHGTLYNLPLDEFMEVIDNALTKGYTVCWDGDVSENGYVYYPTAVAILPADPNVSFEDIIDADTLIQEVEFVDQDVRQKGFETFVTTDDHLEHITGMATDPEGNVYYMTKNSWGDSNEYGGYHFMSEKYVRAKTVSILVNKSSIPKDIRKKLGL
ncbi:MAG TPA: C1 family peptidase [Candidatus Coprenecus stercoravium]|uniref:Aminopeptidase n=1 Tax=Candidatus Coprenecus stercoravium TaxID=2840735 RepID=A0A9D2GN97_9BACT|nr:C1 family peptidase [Candidatus Coprenecus stercoravium]